MQHNADIRLLLAKDRMATLHDEARIERERRGARLGPAARIAERMPDVTFLARLRRHGFARAVRG